MRRIAHFIPLIIVLSGLGAMWFVGFEMGKNMLCQDVEAIDIKPVK